MLFSSKEFKLLTKIKSLGDVQKSLQQLEKKINELSESTNSTAGGEVDDTKGKSGDIKITKGKDNAYTFEIKTEDGWKTPVIGNSAITFKDKPAAISAPKVESIDEIESADSTTGDVKAKKVIFDEKADKFVLSRPDYESDWTDVTNATNYDFTHNLGTKIFKLVQIIFKDDSDRIFYPGVWISEQGTADPGLYAYAKTDDIMEIATGNTNIYEYDNTTLNTNFEHVSDGHIKVMLWK